MRNAIKEFRSLTDKAIAGEQLPKIVSLIDKNAKRSVIHKNKASNLKSKLTKKLNALA
jgi:small subunit ribosomal protein S20